MVWGGELVVGGCPVREQRVGCASAAAVVDDGAVDALVVLVTREGHRNVTPNSRSTVST